MNIAVILISLNFVGCFWKLSRGTETSEDIPPAMPPAISGYVFEFNIENELKSKIEETELMAINGTVESEYFLTLDGLKSLTGFLNQYFRKLFKIMMLLKDKVRTTPAITSDDEFEESIQEIFLTFS